MFQEILIVLKVEFAALSSVHIQVIIVSPNQIWLVAFSLLLVVTFKNSLVLSNTVLPIWHCKVITNKYLPIYGTYK